MRYAFVSLFFLVGLTVCNSCGGDGATAPAEDLVPDPGQVQEDMVPEEDVFTGDLTGVVLETVVSAEEVALGDAVTVTCVATIDGKPVKVRAVVHLLGEESEEGAEPATMEPGEWKPSETGEFQLWCAIEDTEVVDETPAVVKVNLGSIKKITTKVQPKEIPAGATANATCVAEDEDGNKQNVTPGVKAEPAEGVEIASQAITGKKPGEYEIRCKAVGGVEVVSATLTVTLGAPVNYVAAVEPSTIGVGESAEVSCVVTDIAGNEVDTDWVVEAPEAVQVQGSSVTTTKSGSHDIKCAPAQKKGDEKLTAAKLTVEPGAAVGMLVVLKPNKELFAIGDQFTVAHDLVDQYDNVIESAAINPIVVEGPADGAVLQPNKDDRFKFANDGIYTFKVQASEYPYSGQVTATCDSYGPVVTFTHPPRAFTTTGGPTLVATGSVADAVTTVASLEINGTPVQVDPSGNFTYEMTLGHGMNMLSVAALDANGNSRLGFRSVFRSSEFKPTDHNNPMASMVNRSLRIWLSQEFIDDGDHSMPPDDLATIVEIIAESLDLTSLLPEEGIPFFTGTNGGGCTATIDSLTYDKPQVTLQTVDQGVHVIVAIPNLFAELNIECCYEVPYVGLYCDPYYGFITAEAIVLDVYLFIWLDENKKIVAELGPLDVQLEGLDVDIQGLTGMMFDSLVNMLINTLKSMAIDSFSESIGETLPQIIEDAMATLDEGLEIEVPALIGSGPPTPLKVSIRFNELLSSFYGISIEVDAAITAPKTITHNPLGALMRANCLGSEPDPFTLPKDLEMSLGLAADLLNQAAFSIWNGGALTLNLAEEDLASLDVSEYGLQNLELATDLNYAPFVQTCNNDGKLTLQLGDARVHAKFFMLNLNWDLVMYLFLALDVGVGVGVDEEGKPALKITLGEFEVSEIEITEVGPEIRGKESIVVDLFKNTLLGEIKKSIGEEGITFALPDIDLSTLSEDLPPGIMLSIDPQKVAVEDGFVVIGGKLK